MSDYLKIAREALRRLNHHLPTPERPAEETPQRLPSQVPRPAAVSPPSKGITDRERQDAYERAVLDANRVYRGGPIDWPAVDAAFEAIQQARTRRELQAAVRQYVAAVVVKEGEK